MTYKVSIIIPLYNAAEFIIDTLKSIENQTMDFNDIEVILVNDSSTDNTVEIVNEYSKNHENIVLINLVENAGSPATPRNIGITYASAKYLMFLDQDDVFKSNACEVLYNKISSTSVDMVCGNHNMVSNGHSHKCFNFDSWAKRDEIKINNINENPNFLSMGVAAWSKIFRTEFVIENNLKFTEGVGEDILFSIRALLLANGIIFLKDFIVIDYIVRSKSLSHTIDAGYVDEFTDFYLNFYEYCENNIDDELYQPLFSGRMNQYFSVLFNANLYYDEFSKILIKIQELFTKINTKAFKFENESYQLFFDIILKDEFPFNNSILTYSTIRSNREGKFDSSIKYLKQKAKLYIDCGRGFNEEDTVNREYRISDVNEVDFDLTSFENIEKIRFDPISWYFITCDIKEITSDIGRIDFIAKNAIKEVQDKQQFITTDSQYMIYGDFKEDINHIKIKFHIDLLDNKEITNIVDKIE